MDDFGAPMDKVHDLF